MKTRKAVLAKLLAAALAVTTIVPGVLPVNAAKVVTTTATENAETQNTWTLALEEGNVGGTQMWNFQSGSGNRNDNDDFSSADGPAVTYASNWDVTYTEENPATISLDLYPNGTVEHMRFGILVKYIDPTHWAYLNYDAQKSGNHWMLQYDGTHYPEIAGLAGVSLSDNAYTNVKIEYLSADQIKVTVTPDGGEAVAATLDNEILGTLETFAADNEEPIHFGFKGGTWSTQYTNINFKNVKKGTGDELEDVDFDSCGWTWVKEDVNGQVMTDTDYVGGTNYKVLDAKEGAAVSAVNNLTDFENGTVSAVVRQPGNVNFAVAAKYNAEGGKVQVGYNGSNWYQTVGDVVTTLDSVNFVPESGKDYTVNMEIVDNRLSVSITPLEEGAEEVPLVSGVDVSGVAAGSIAFEAGNGTELWMRNVNYTKVVKADPTELQETYNTVKEEKGETNTDNKYYSDTWALYEEALTAVKTFLEDEAAEKTPNEVNTLKNTLNAKADALALVDKTTLENRYNELKEEEQGYFTDDSWAVFVNALNDAKDVLDKIAAKESIASTEVSGALTSMNNAVRGLTERAATTEEKAELQALYATAEAAENKNYTDESWNAFSNALAAAKNALESATVTNTQVAEIMEALDNALKGLTGKLASAEEKQALSSFYDSVKAAENNNYTAESWKAYQDALKAVEDILAKGDAATQTEVQNALNELKRAYGVLQNSRAITFEKTAYTVDATASVETKVNANTAAITYKSSDTSVATVDAKGVVTGVRKGKAVITAEAAGISATTTVTVTVPKITLTATSTKLQVKKSTKAIKVASKIVTDSVVSWTSSNKKVATVTKAGKVKAKKTGKTTLTVTMKSGATATCKLKVQKGKVVTKSVKVSSTKVTLSPGEKYEIGAVRNPITATEKITYTVNKKKVASVSKKGVITAKAKGTCKVTVKCNGKKKVITVTVK